MSYIVLNVYYIHVFNTFTFLSLNSMTNTVTNCLESYIRHLYFYLRLLVHITKPV